MKLFSTVGAGLLSLAVLLSGSYFLYDRSGEFEKENGMDTTPEFPARNEVTEEISAAAHADTEPQDGVISYEEYPSKNGSDDPGRPADAAGKPTSVSFTFLGDCILSSYAGDVREDTFSEYAKYESDSYFFKKAVPYYKDSDFVVANSEFVLSDRALPKISKEGNAFWFKSPASHASILRAGNIDIVSIANNHTFDYGDEGYADTKQSLENAGITWGDVDNPVYVTKNGITFGIICTKMFGTGYDSVIAPAIREVKENSDIQILFFHGGTENTHVPDEWLVEMCHSYADMGIDLIVGSHPHVLLPMEEYNGVDIFYSLGNFCYGGNRTPENRTVILTETFNFDENGVYTSQEETFTPFYVYTGDYNNWQPAPIEDPMEQSKVVSFMYGKSALPY
ncbi:MAG: CapA family protein [Huintestinicola sp.]